MSTGSPYPRGQTTTMVYYDDRSTGTTVTTGQWPPYRGPGMGSGYQRKLTGPEKAERAKKQKAEQEKAIKRKVLGPKRSRWG